MSLNRLENFLKSSRGKIIYVNNENLDATDSISSGGSSPFTPFKSLQRALLEATRYSYQIGNSNDRFNFCSIVVAPGEYFIDNRPGLTINDTGTGYLRSGATATLSQFDLTTILDVTDEDNKLYLLNSVWGGIIVPRGTSIIAQDPRKTVFRPLYVPDPRNENIERSAIFRITGASFFWSFSIEDADPTGFCYKNYNTSKFTPNFSHHKLTAFEYVDGVNPIEINDTFLNVTTTRTDLEQYYEKVSLVYGPTSGREIDNVSYIGGVSVDIQPVIDEYRIVGPRGDVIGISSITSGNGITPSSTITVTLDQEAEGISVDTSVQVSGVNQNGFDGQFVVSAVPSPNQIQYITSTVPAIANPAVFGATLNIISDTVSSASPYVFNILLKSVYGMCGLHADGSKVLGFKSVVVAQFTAISLQKDDDAFVIYDEASGNYLDATAVKDLYKNTRSKYKPEYQSYHIKLSNDAFAQLVSVFSIGYAAQIIAEGGGDYSITNSNSNFGAKTFISSGYKNEAFDQDDHGFIVGVIPPEEIEQKTIGVEFPQINIGLTTSVSAGAATTSRLYFYNETNSENPPLHYKDGFRIGAKINDRLNIENPGSASSRIVIPGTNASYQKSSIVQTQNNGFQNAINDGVITLTSAHNFAAEEKVRVISQNGHLPDGISPDTVYYVIDSTIDNSLSNSQIKLAVTKNNAINNVAILPNKKGGKLFIVSRVSDKIPGDPGHPIQWDSSNNNWYITVSSSDNGIYDLIRNSILNVTGRTYIERTPDNRKEENKLHKILYCIPKNTTTAARPPVNGFILQESSGSSLSGTEFDRYFGATDLSVDTEIRNPKFISTASWVSSEVTISTELTHKLNVGDLIEIDNVIPVAYNGTFTVTKTPTSRSFTYELTSDPGVFSNNTRVRNSDLPYVKRKNTRNIFRIFKSEETQKFIRNKQDGLYELTVVHTSVKPTIQPFTDNSFSQPVQNLYPRLDRDNPDSDPNQTSCFAEHNIIGNVLVDDAQNSISKEAVNKFNSDLNLGIGITSIISNSTGTAHTIYTSVEHGLSGITGVSLVSAGSSYITGTYYGVGTATTFNGQSASFRVVVDASQTVTEVEIMSNGSNYSVGNTVSVVSGIGTTTGFVAAVLGITSVAPISNKVISLSNYVGDFVGYNDSYVINNISGTKVINVSSASTIAGFSTTAVNYNAYGSINGEVLSISSFTYDNVSGIATVTTSVSHGLKPNTKIRLSGFNSSFYNRDVYVSSINSLTQVEVNVGVSTSAPSTTGTRIIVPLGIGPIDSKSRLTYYYSDIKSVSGTSLSVNASESVPFEIVNAQTSGLKKGDYIESNSEIMRIKGSIDSSFVDVYRAQLGSERKAHSSGSVVRKINVVPVEFRRNSIIRASGHTFEYVGYGAGNYSTSLPENQDREIERDERLISQSTKDSGGTVYYGGMDEYGDFYSANRKFSSSTGEQQVYDLPIPTVVSESSIEESLNIVETEKALVTGSIKVDGGENNDIISQFNGPLVLNKKLTSYSEEGIEATSLFLKGDQKVSRRYTISTNTPTFAGNYGDIVYRASPTVGENIGWVYTLQDQWQTWGYVGSLGTQIYLYSGDESGPNTLEGIVDKLKFVGDSNGFGIDVDIEVDSSSGFGTIVLRNPIDVVNFGNTVLGLDTPRFTTRSQGSRVVYRSALNNQNVDYAVGVSTNTLWNSIPRNTGAFSYKWFAGETEIMSLSGDGKLSVSNGILAGINGDINGNATTATTAENLDRTVTAGIGLTGGGALTSNITLNVGQGEGISASANAISVDSTVVRTTGIQTIGGNKTFSGNVTFDNVITGNINGSAANATNATFAGRANNLNRSVNTGSGLSGGGSLDNQDLNLSVDNTVVRTTGTQTIAGNKTFSNQVTISSDGRVVGDFTVDGKVELGQASSENNVLWGTTRNLDSDGNIFILQRGLGSPDEFAWLYEVDNLGNLNFNISSPPGQPFNWQRTYTFKRDGEADARKWRDTSDYRLKTNIISIKNSLSKIENLNPVTFEFKDNPSKAYSGFIAHELQEFIPTAVSGIKDAIDDDGNPLYQSVDNTSITAELVSAMKEIILDNRKLNKKIESLENEIYSLKEQLNAK